MQVQTSRDEKYNLVQQIIRLTVMVHKCCYVKDLVVRPSVCITLRDILEISSNNCNADVINYLPPAAILSHCNYYLIHIALAPVGSV